MKKIYRLLVIGLLLFNATNIQALNLGEVTDGDSGSEGRDSCAWPNYDGCFWWSENFMIRVSLVDEQFKLVKGTKTVEFSPINPYSPNDFYGTYDMDKSNSEYGVININRTEYNFVGSHIARNPDTNVVTGRYPELMADKGYYVYLGFGKNKAVANNFSDYAKNREQFIKFVTRLEPGIYVQDINKNVDFLSFFLKVSGYENVWNATEYLDKTVDLGYNHKYFLLMEPVYMYTQWNNGNKEYNARGTAKQLASFYTQSSFRYKGLFRGAAEDLNVIYNHTCNFRDLSDNYSKMYKRAFHEDENANVISNKQYEFMYKNACENINNMRKIDPKTYANALSTISYAGSGFGVNIVDIAQIIKTRTPNLEQASCTLSIDSCAKTSGETVQPNDDFYIQTKFTNTEGKLQNCIVPKIASDEQLNEYVYSVGEGNNKLWCYDDITYDFSKLKSALLEKTFSTNQLVEIPNGTLKVDRTCYTKSSDILNTGYLDHVFVNDPGEYQQNFKFDFNNKELVFERNTNKYKQGDNETYKMLEECNTKHTECTYKYTSTFYYDYELKDSLSGGNLNINVSDLSLNNGIKNTNSLEFITSYDKSKIIKTNNQYSTGTYTSSLSTQISNGYGLTNKLYEKLLSKTNDKTTLNTGTENEIDVNRLSNNKVSELLKIDLEQNSKKTCNVNTTIDKKNEGKIGSAGSAGSAVFRVISLNNPFPARDGTSRLPGSNWLTGTDNNVYDYIENNRDVKKNDKNNDAESVYNKEPLYTITLTPSTMVKIREYNKSHNYSNIDMTCESGTGRMCVDNFIRDSKYIPELNGTCKTLTSKEITQFNNRIKEFELSGCNNQTQCMTMKKDIVNELDTNKDGYVTNADYLNADFYTCADKTYRSGG